MYTRFYPLGLALLLACPVTTHAREAATPLTLNHAVALALDNNPELSAARHELAAVDATVMQAGARPNPDLSTLMEDTRKSTRTTTIQLNQPIELGGKRDARIGAAERSRDAARMELAIRRDDIRIAATSAFFAVLTAQERRRLAQESAELARSAADATGRRVTAGKISPVEETRARVAAASARLELSQADGELDLARRRLAGLWGNAQPSFTLAEGVAGQLPPLPAIADIAERSADAPQLRLARVEVERRQALSKIESSKRIPDATLSLGRKRDEEAGRSMWVIGVSLPLPFLDSNRGNLEEALRRTDKARDELAAAETRVRTDIAQAYEKLRNAHTEVALLHSDILPGAQSAYAAAGKGFELGKFNFLEVLDAQRTLFQARSQYLRAISDAHLASAELERLLGSAGTNQ
jgi:cobalt-zinc-cadmium efflux system outer membrane protein